MDKKEINDTKIVDWMNDHATFMIIINDDGNEEAIKVCGDDVCFRDIIIEKFKKEGK